MTSGINIKEQIGGLVNLQALDTQIYRLEKEKGQQPQRISDLQNAFEEKKANLKALENRSKEQQVQLKSKETDLLSKEDAIQKAQTQLYQIKTNKEYQAKLTEIEGIKADKSVIEEAIIKMFDDVDALKKEASEEKARLAEEEKKFNVEKNQIEERLKEIEQQLGQLEAKRSQVVVNVDKAVLAQYERILRNKNGLALVAVKDDSCQGCFMNVPPQVINEIKMKDKLVICELCARILYIEGEF